MVHWLGLVGAVPALVLGVAEDVADGQHVEGIALPAGEALVKKRLGDAANAHLPVGVEIEDPAHHLGLRFVDGEDAVFFVVAPQRVAAQHAAVFDGLAEAELQPLGELAHLVLGYAGHDHQAKLAVCVQGVDVVVLEEHAYAVVQKLLGVLDAVQGGAGEAGDLLGDDEVEAPCLGVPDHSQEAVPPLGGGAG